MIATIRAMRTLSKKYLMQADSLAEIRGGLDLLAFELRDQRVGNRPVSEGHVINAAILALLGMGEEERHRIAIEAFAKMNVLMALDEPTSEQVHAIVYSGEQKTPAERGDGDADLGGGVILRDTDPGSAPKKPRGRKSS